MTTVVKPRVGWGDLLWVAWRTHRTAILAMTGLTAAVVAGVFVLMGMTDTELGGLPAIYFRLFWQPQDTNLLFGAVIAVFWGAPLVAREHEARTNLLAWGQDVPATRWLAGQVVLLGAVATCLAAMVWMSEQYMVDTMRELSEGRTFTPFTTWYEVAPHLQIGYALFGLALGLAAGVLVRRTLPAMGIALVGFGVVRVAVIEWARPYLRPPVHTFEAWNADYKNQVPDYAMYVGSGYADANGVRIDYQGSWGCGDRVGSAGQLDCLKANGVAGHFAEFQPLERLGLFQWIETGIFVVLAAALLALAWAGVKRARRV
ncbi:hypothetical protein ACFFQW_45410 [Umezawaea endophytica]|uniref:ABC-2 family transporter n=1 Tax=Umezawaea endophytica TaxID=1654476 RepID=A0A9X2VS45_9PSEU|nr:hypothetical protein [Umezawaea endophytica]MCS7481730.1 hypothetical protein [Umezawaea endophytica]